MLKVAHLKEVYLPISETFVYSYLTGMERVESHVIAEKLENEALFPFDRKHILAVESGPLRDYTRLVHKVTRSPKTNFSVLPRSPYAELMLRKIKADVAHAHGGYDGFRYACTGRRLGLPYVTTFYGRDIGAGSRHPYWRRAYKILFGLGDLFLVEGPVMQGKLARLGCPENKIRLQRIGVDLARFSRVEAKPRSSGEKTVFLMCGRMVEKKGFQYGIHAFARVSARFPQARMRIIGDGAELGQLEHLVSSLRLDGRVEFLGSMPHEQYARESRVADIFVQPSVTAADGDSEGGAPTTLLEMQALGVPVVTTYHDDIPNVVSPGKSALLAAERDVEGLAEKMRYLLENPGAREEMGTRGREFVEKRHDIALLAVELEDTYEEIARMRRGN